MSAARRRRSSSPGAATRVLPAARASAEVLATPAVAAVSVRAHRVAHSSALSLTTAASSLVVDDAHAGSRAERPEAPI